MLTINKNLMNRNHTNMKRTNAQIQWIVLHYVGALGDAYDNTEYYGNNDVGASADFFVGHKGDVWQANDYRNYYSWHCGGSYQSCWTENDGGKYYGVCTNQNSIGIEMCVRKRSTATMNATDRDWYFEDATVNSALQLVAYLMKELNVDINHVITHYMVNRKICPNPWVMDNSKWVKFKADLAAMTGTTVAIQPTSTATVDNFYRGRKTWADAKSQLGAYTVLQNAKDNCPEGYHVYDSNGKVVYTPAAKSYDQLTAKDLKGTEAEKIAKVASIYQEVMKKTGMLASVGMAQFCLESGFGTTDLAINANNMHGMKCSLSGNTWAGSTWDGVSKYTKQTAEQTPSGQVYYVTADFRKYPTIMKSVEDRAAYFIGAMNGSAKRFPNINMIQDAKTQVSLIKAGGYATDVNYVSKLMSLIERFNLTQYDKGITPEVWSKAPAKTTTVAPTTSISYYRVAKSYANGVYTGQVGAYSSKDNALKTAKERQLVAFNPDGSVLADYTPKSGYYRVAKSYTNGSYVGQVGAYTNKDNALKTAKEKQLVAFNPDGSVLADYTPKPVKTGTKTVTMASLLLDKCKEINDQMLADIKAGIKWKYSNTRKLSPTFAKARSSKNYYCNCAKMPLWALKMLGVVPENAEGFYGRRDGKLIFKSAETKKAIQAACDIIDINMKKTVNQAIKDGTLQPGDIVTYYNPLQHTNIYAGGKKWYDSGHAYGGGSGEAPFKTWYGDTVYGGYKISHIIRLRGTKIVTTVDTNQYRVQVGSYLLKDNADNMFNIVKRTGLDVKIVRYDGEYVVQLDDLFSNRADAEKLVATAAAKGIIAIVKEV